MGEGGEGEGRLCWGTKRRRTGLADGAVGAAVGKGGAVVAAVGADVAVDNALMGNAVPCCTHVAPPARLDTSALLAAAQHRVLAFPQPAPLLQPPAVPSPRPLFL